MGERAMTLQLADLPRPDGHAWIFRVLLRVDAPVTLFSQKRGEFVDGDRDIADDIEFSRLRLFASYIELGTRGTGNLHDLLEPGNHLDNAVFHAMSDNEMAEVAVAEIPHPYSVGDTWIQLRDDYRAVFANLVVGDLVIAAASAPKPISPATIRLRHLPQPHSITTRLPDRPRTEVRKI